MRESLTLIAFILLTGCTADHRDGTETELTASDTTIHRQSSNPAGIDSVEITPPKEIEWGDPPPAFEPGSHMAILEGDPSKEGEIYTFRIKMPPNYFVAPHTHPLPERVVVLEGTLRLGQDEEMNISNTEKLETGTFFTIPPEQVHYVISGEEDETILHITGMGPLILNYVNPEDDPRLRNN